MKTDADDMGKALRDLIDKHRRQCLWFLRTDYYPQTATEATRCLDQIQRHGNLDAFRRAGELKQWLLRNSSAASVV